jgi:hypothetical protein
MHIISTNCVFAELDTPSKLNYMHDSAEYLPQLINSKIPVLLTSSVIAHDTGVALKNTDERIRLALESVEHWLKIEPTLRLVLCDGSNFNFSSIIAEKFPLAQIECLYFENNQALVKKHGRGYGEGEIVRYAVKHSKFIATARSFAKCTSKLWVENYAQCLTSWNGSLLCKGVFLNVFSLFKRTTFSYIDTRFYIVSCRHYKKYFEDAHLQVDSNLGRSLEDCFFDIFLKYKIEKSLFKAPPIICGMGGGIGLYYKNSVKRKIKEKLRLRLVRMNKSFSYLFVE